MQLLLVLARRTVLYFCSWLLLYLGAIRYIGNICYLWAVRYLQALLLPADFGEAEFLLLDKLDITFGSTPSILVAISFTPALHRLSQAESRLSRQVSLDFHPPVIFNSIQNALVFGPVCVFDGLIMAVLLVGLIVLGGGLAFVDLVIVAEGILLHLKLEAGGGLLEVGELIGEAVLLAGRVHVGHVVVRLVLHQRPA